MKDARTGNSAEQTRQWCMQRQWGGMMLHGVVSWTTVWVLIIPTFCYHWRPVVNRPPFLAVWSRAVRRPYFSGCPVL